MFSSRLDADLTPGRLQRALDRLRASGEPFLDLTRSNPPQCGLGPTSDQLTRALAVPRTAEYSPDPCGMLGARQAVARYYADRGLPTEPEAIFLSASTSQTYAELIKLFANPGGEILVPQPSYPLFEMLVALEGCRLTRFPSYFSPESGWRIDERAFRQAFSARTRAVILVNPNNPTGAYLAPEQLASLERVCAAKGCPLILDEVFHDYPAEGCSAAGAASEETQGLVLRLSGLSKVIGAPQIKLGWVRMSGAQSAVQAASSRLEFIADAYLSASTPAQLAAEALLPARGPLQAKIRERLGENQRAAGQVFAAGSPAHLLPREGGWYLVLGLPEGEDDEDLTYQLLVEDRVVVQPGFFFDFPQGEHLVICLLTPSAEFAEGMQRIATRLAARAAGKYPRG